MNKFIIDAIEENGDLRVTVETVDGKKYLQWYRNTQKCLEDIQGIAETAQPNLLLNEIVDYFSLG